MPALILKTSPYFSLLKHRFLQDIREEKKSDLFAPVTVLVGSHLLGVHLGRELGAAPEGIINVNFITFQELARRLAGTDLKNRPLLPRAAPLEIVRGLVKEIKPDAYFYKVRERLGLPPALLATFADLREGLVAPQDLTVISHKKIRELSDLYAAWLKRLQNFAPDTTELILRSADQTAAFKQLFGAGRLLVYGFYDLNAEQKHLVSALAAQVDLIVYMPYGDAKAFTYAQPLYAWYGELGFKEIRVKDESAGNQGSRLVSLHRYLLSEEVSTPKYAEHDSSVALIAAAGEYAEAKEAVRGIRALTRTAGLKYEDFAVAFRSTDVYASVFQELLEAHDIPYFMPGGWKLALTREARSLKALFNLVRGINSDFPFSRMEVMDFISYAPFDWPRILPDGREPDLCLWETAAQEAGIIKGEHQWEARLNALIADNNGEGGEPKFIPNLISAAKELLFFIKKIFPRLKDFPPSDSWSGFVKRTNGLLEDCFPSQAVWQQINTALTGLMVLDAVRTPILCEDFFRAAEECLAAESLPVGRYRRGGVHLLEVMALRGLKFKAVFLLGLSEGSFPAIVRQDPALLDHERQRINSRLKSGAELPLKSRRLEEERLLFALAAEAAEQYLYLSYPRLERQSGRERRPSFLLLDAARGLTGAAEIKSLAHQSIYSRLPLSHPSPRSLGLALDAVDYDRYRAWQAGGGNEPEAASYIEKLTPIWTRRRDCEQARRSPHLTVYDGVLAAEEAKRILNADFSLTHKVWSASQLETYARCPFGYFMQYVLYLRRWQEPEEAARINPVEKGNLLHKILQRSYEEFRKQNLFPWHPGKKEQYLAIIRAEAQKQFARWEARGLTGYKLQWEADQEEMIEDLEIGLNKEIKNGGSLQPSAFEFRFGKREGTELVLPFGPGEEVRFQGVIDRIDMGAEAFRVIDYKSGKIKAGSESLAGGEALQNPIYLLAAAKYLGEREIAKGQSGYQSVSRAGAFTSVFYSGEEWSTKEALLKEVLQTILSGIKSGLFFPYPGPKDESCTWCDYKKICSGGMRRAWLHKQSDPAAESFLKMKEVE